MRNFTSDLVVNIISLFSGRNAFDFLHNVFSLRRANKTRLGLRVSVFQSRRKLDSRTLGRISSKSSSSCVAFENVTKEAFTTSGVIPGGVYSQRRFVDYSGASLLRNFASFVLIDIRRSESGAFEFSTR